MSRPALPPSASQQLTAIDACTTGKGGDTEGSLALSDFDHAPAIAAPSHSLKLGGSSSPFWPGLKAAQAAGRASHMPAEPTLRPMLLRL